MVRIKKHLNKIILPVMIITLLVGILIYKNRCTLDGTQVCYDKKIENYKIEEGAEIKVQVENEALGEYLVATWNHTHPTFKDKLTYTVKEPLNLTQLADDFETDVIVTSLNNAAYILNDTFDLGKELGKTILMRSSRSLEDTVNLNGNYFIPNSVSGWTFIYNKTLAEELGIDLTDENQDGLPDAFETWENLVLLEDKVYKELEILFPLSFKDQYSFYPFLTAGKWHLNFTNVGNDAGFSHPEFLRGLNFIEYLSNQNLYKEKVLADEMPWQYNTAFFERKAVFSLMADWMNLDYFEGKTDDEYIISKFPSYEGNTLRPKGNVDGYMVSKSSKYPSASTEAIRILRSAEAFKHYKSSDDKVFVYHRNYLDELDANERELQMIRALNYIDPDPVMVVEDAPSVLSRSFFYETDMMEVFKDLYDKKINAEKAQEKIVEIYEAWLHTKQTKEGS